MSESTEGSLPIRPLSGFILTRERREVDAGFLLEIWVLSDIGPVKLVTELQRELFFVRQADQSAIENQLKMARIAYEYRPLDLTNFQQAPVAALYFVRSQALYKAKDLLEAAGIVCYENEIRLSDRFLMERFVYGSASFASQAKPIKRDGYYELPQAQLKSAEYTPSFKVLSLDIECSEQGELFSIGLSAKGYQCVLMIGEPQKSAPDWIEWVANEKALLQGFVQKLRVFDPDIIIGWNVVNFDLRLLIKRAKTCNVTLALGRDNSTIRWRDAPGEVDQGFVAISGRVVVDGIDALKTATYQFENFSLEFVAQSLLGKGKKTEDVHNRLEAIQHDFLHNKVKLAEYNLQDCQLVFDIFAFTNILDFLRLRSQLTGLELDRVGGSVAAFNNLYLPKLHRAGYVSPKRPGSGGLASPGGYVMDSVPGLYENVLVLDFKSLYPSIIRTFKVDPLGLVEGLLAPEIAISGYKGAMFSRDKHFLPDIITSLWQQRDQAKKNQDAARSQAIKILMNSFYGILGSGGCPFYDTRLASSITLRGHDIMQTTAEWIEAEGYKVIYGDTDSTFVWLEGKYSAEDVERVGLDLQNMINQRWDSYIQRELQLENYMEIEFETHFSRFLMPTIRGSEQGSKKRYAGLKVVEGGEELVFKGMETVRSDWTALAKNFQTELYRMVFAGEDVRDYLRHFIKATRAGQYDAQLVYRKRLRRRLADYTKNVPPHVKAARLADSINQDQGRRLQYQHKGAIVYLMTINGPEPVEYSSSRIDYDHYIDKQLRPIAEAILPFVGVSFDELASAQLGLF